MAKKYEVVNCGNYYTSKGFRELCDHLEAGEKVMIYIDCIGHTRNHTVTAQYVEALRLKYAQELRRDNDTAWTPLYYLELPKPEQA